MFHPMRRLSRLALVAAAGAAAAYLLDPQQGTDRRAALRERLGPLAERMPQLRGVVGSAGGDQDGGADGGGGGDADGGAGGSGPRATSGPFGPGLEDRVGNEWRPDVPEPSADHTLEDRVRSEVLGRAEFDRLGVLVNDVEGVVELRGAVADEQVVGQLVQAVRGVRGVRDVVDLTHRPGQPAPNKVPSE
jgi:hypothetical protein